MVANIAPKQAIALVALLAGCFLNSVVLEMLIRFVSPIFLILIALVHRIDL